MELGGTLAEGPARPRRTRSARATWRSSAASETVLKDMQGGGQETLATDTVVHAVLRGLRDALRASRSSGDPEASSAPVARFNSFAREMPKGERWRSSPVPSRSPSRRLCSSRSCGSSRCRATARARSSAARARVRAAPAARTARREPRSPAGADTLRRRGSDRSTVYHGSAPGVEGLTRAIDKAHGAVAASQQGANSVEDVSRRSACHERQRRRGRRTRPPPRTSTAHASTPCRRPHGRTTARTARRYRTKHTRPRACAAKVASRGDPAPAGRRRTRAQAGQVAVVLFWNPNGADDDAVHEELQVLLAVAP